jgi:hypothetical protein
MPDLVEHKFSWHHFTDNAMIECLVVEAAHDLSEYDRHFCLMVGMMDGKNNYIQSSHPARQSVTSQHRRWRFTFKWYWTSRWMRRSGRLPHRRPTAVHSRTSPVQQMLQINNHSIGCPWSSRRDRLRLSDDNRRPRSTDSHNEHPRIEKKWCIYAIVKAICTILIHAVCQSRLPHRDRKQPSTAQIKWYRSKFTWITQQEKSLSNNSTEIFEKTSVPLTSLFTSLNNGRVVTFVRELTGWRQCLFEIEKYVRKSVSL